MLSELACTLSERIVSGYVALWITITNCCTGLPTSSACHIKKAIKCSYPIVSLSDTVRGWVEQGK